MTELELPERLELQTKVIELYLQGQNETAIAKQLQVKRTEVLSHLQEWREVAKNDEAVKDRAREALLAMDNHYALIVKEFWQLIRDADSAGDLRTKNSALKNVADVEAKRVEKLREAGILSDETFGNEMADLEEKMAALKAILNEVSAGCNHCRTEVRRRLSNIFNSTEGVVVEDAQP